jgi:hypothetical protein
MEYFSTRTGTKIIKLEDFYNRFKSMLIDFEGRDYFKEKLKLYRNSRDKNYVNTKSKSNIGIKIYPFDSWSNKQQKEIYFFDTIEFLFRFVSKPGEFGYISDHTGCNTEDYLSYDEKKGKNEFRYEMNILLRAYGNGYELQNKGMILFRGDDTVNFIKTEFPKYGNPNIDFEIDCAIKWWKNRNQSIEEKKQAILKLAGVLEYLKQDRILSTVLENKDTRDLFNIANNFGLRHNNPDQKIDFDKDIWYDWIFQYYLNTCIGVLKIINKNN